MSTTDHGEGASSGPVPDAPGAPGRGRLRRVVVLLAIAAVALTGVVLYRERGGDDPFASYCAVVRDEQRTLGAALAAGPTSGLLRALPVFEKLQEQAPRDIRDEWSIVVSRVSELRDALRAAGVEPVSYDPAKPPPGLSQQQREAIETAAVRLGARATALALAGVQQQARDVCKTPLSL